MNSIKITASIVIYKNNWLEIKRILDCLIAEKNIKIYLSDNSPTDSLKDCLSGYKEVEYIFNRKNLGFGRAHNVAIQKAIEYKSQYHLLVNPDIYFLQGEVQKILDFMEKDDRIGAVMPKVLYPDEKIQYLCKLIPTPFNLIFRRFFPFERLRKKWDYLYEMRFSNYDKIMDVPCLSGCFLVVKTKALEKTGGFDERYFLYLEDFDLLRRIGKSYRTVFFPEACVYHEYTKGSYKNLKLLKYHIVSAIKYFCKWGWFIDQERTRINSQCLKTMPRQ